MFAIANRKDAVSECLARHVLTTAICQQQAHFLCPQPNADVQNGSV